MFIPWCVGGNIGVASIEEKMIENWLRWFRHAKKAIVGTSGDLRRAVCMILTLWIEVEGNQKAHCRKLLK